MSQTPDDPFADYPAGHQRDRATRKLADFLAKHPHADRAQVVEAHRRWLSVQLAILEASGKINELRDRADAMQSEAFKLAHEEQAIFDRLLRDATGAGWN